MFGISCEHRKVPPRCLLPCSLVLSYKWTILVSVLCLHSPIISSQLPFSTTSSVLQNTLRFEVCLAFLQTKLVPLCIELELSAFWLASPPR